MKAAKIILLSAVILFFYDAAYACSCAPTPSPRQALKEAKAVFSGKVVSGEVFEVEDRFGTSQPVVRVKFLVSRVWKGVDSAEAFVHTSGFNPACGFSFEKGKEYLVYAYPDVWKLNGLVTGICNRTTELGGAAKDLRAIGKGNKPASRQLSGMFELLRPDGGELIFRRDFQLRSAFFLNRDCDGLAINNYRFFALFVT